MELFCSNDVRDVGLLNKKLKQCVDINLVDM